MSHHNIHEHAARDRRIDSSTGDHLAHHPTAKPSHGQELTSLNDHAYPHSYAVPLSDANSPPQPPHMLSHLTRISSSKKAVDYDTVSHQPTVSSISNDFIVHTGPLTSHSSIGVGVGSTDRYIEPKSDYETEYEHAFTKPNHAAYNHHVNYEHVDHLSSPSNGHDMTNSHHYVSEVVHMKPTKRLDNLWMDMDVALTSLSSIMVYEKVWIDLALKKVKDRKVDSAIEYAYIRLNEICKAGIQEKYAKMMTLTELEDEKQKLRFAEMFVVARDHLQGH
jgi:hypothetical protein